MAFNCELCVFTTHKKYNFQKHLRSQRHFINEHRPNIQPKLVEITPVMTVVEPVVHVVETVVEVVDPVPVVIGFKCKYCNKSYRHRSSLSNHVNHYCIKKDEDMIKQMNTTIEFKTKYIKHLKKELRRVYSLLDKKNNHEE